MPGMGDMSSMMGGAGGDFGGIDFSKLGQGPENDEAEEEEEEDDEDMPELEGDEEEEKEPAAASSSKTSSKIEEVA